MKKLSDFISRDPKHFVARWYEDGTDIEREFTLDMKMDKDGEGSSYEWQYALADIADELNALEVGETMYFQGNRDDKNTKGYIVRTA